MKSDSETPDEPAHENCYWPSESSDHDVSDIEEISTRLPEELARLHALAPRLIPSKLLDTTIQGLILIDKIIRRSLRNGQGPTRRAENKCLTDICSKCHQWLCGDCLPRCTCEEVVEACEEVCETVAEAEETEVTGGIEEIGEAMETEGTEVEEMEGTEETQEACQVHCGMYPLLFPSQSLCAHKYSRQAVEVLPEMRVMGSGLWIHFRLRRRGRLGMELASLT